MGVSEAKAQVTLIWPGRLPWLRWYLSSPPQYTQELCGGRSPWQLPARTGWQWHSPPVSSVYSPHPHAPCPEACLWWGAWAFVFWSQFPSSLPRSYCQNLFTYSVSCLIPFSLSQLLVPSSFFPLIFSHRE